MKKLCILLSIIMIFISFFGFTVNYKRKVLTTNISNNYKDRTLIIDAGHGGFDGGASSSDGTPEKDINLKISLFLNEYLQLLGYETVLTRDSDISLEDSNLTSVRTKKRSDIFNRFELMNKFPQSLFISVHQNYYPEEKYFGMQVFYSPGNSSESSKLAEAIQQETVDKLQNNNTRQIKPCTTSVYLVYNAPVPAVLVECGFLSNTVEAKMLKTQDYQKELAFCIALGTVNFINS